MKVVVDGRLLFTFVVFLIFTGAVFTSAEWSVYARLFPWAITIPAAVLCVVQLVADLKRHYGSEVGLPELRHTSDSDEETDLPRREALTRVLKMFAWIVGLFLAVWLIGLVISPPLFVFLYLRLQAQERWSVALAGAATFTAFQLGLFHYALHVPWPKPAFPWVELALLSILGGTR